MQQLGGTASLIILQCKKAMDITPLSVYPNEKESLLAPGTRLKVRGRTAARGLACARPGAVAHPNQALR